MEKTQYGRIYSEIAKGYSEVIIDNNTYYFKHPSQVESFEIFDRYKVIFDYAKSKGLYSEQENIDIAIKGGWWTSANEERINALKNLIISLKQTKERLIFPSQKAEIQKQILRNERILLSYAKERKDAIGFTAENYAGERFHDESIIKLTYKNKELTERVFHDDNEYYYLSDGLVEKIRGAFFEYSAVLNTDKIKIVAATGFLQNLLYISSDNSVSFWGKPIITCTKYQIDLLMYGKIIKNLIKYKAESGESISEEILNDPEKLSLLLDGNSNTQSQSSAVSSQSSESGTNKVTSFVGATSEDLKQMGVKVEKIGGKSLLEMVKERGGKMNKQDYLDARLKM